jgi:hypothetical protein
MKFGKLAAIFGVLVCAASSMAAGWILKQNKATGRGLVSHVADNGSVDVTVVLNRILPSDATSWAIGEFGADSQGFDIGFTNADTQLWVWRFTLDGKLWDKVFLGNFTGTATQMVGFADFNGDDNGELVVYRPEVLTFTNFQIGVGGNVESFQLDTTGVDLGTFITPVGLGDMDGDGDPDINMMDPNTMVAKRLYFQDKVATKIARTGFNAWLRNAQWVGSFDVDQNGSPDFFAWREKFDLRLVMTQGVERFGQTIVIPDTMFNTILAVGGAQKATG